MPGAAGTGNMGHVDFPTHNPESGVTLCCGGVGKGG